MGWGEELWYNMALQVSQYNRNLQTEVQRELAQSRVQQAQGRLARDPRMVLRSQGARVPKAAGISEGQAVVWEPGLSGNPGSSSSCCGLGVPDLPVFPLPL